MSNNITIAISGKSGCGNTTVSRLVADSLGIAIINYTFRSVAEELSITFDEVRRRAEIDDTYDTMVDTRQIELASKQNCVLGSRLSIWLLPDAELRVYLDASLDVRAKRIHEREGGDFEQVLDETQNRDACDGARYLRLYGYDINDFSCADLIIDANSDTQFEIAETIVRAVKSL